MLIVRAVLAATALVVAWNAFAVPSNPPTPAPSKAASQPQGNASTNQAKPEADQRATPAQPAVIELLKAPVIRIEATDKTEKHNDYASHEWWLVYLTGLLALITGALALYTAKLYRATVKLGEDAGHTSARQAKETANALQISRDTLELAREESKKQETQWFNSHMVWGDIARASSTSAKAAERAVRTMSDTAHRQLRAYISVDAVLVKWADEPDDVTIKIVMVVVNFKNLGHTPAHEVWAWMRVASMPPEQPVFDIEVMEESVEGFGTQGPGQINHLSDEVQLEHRIGLVRAWKEGEASLYVYGSIEYRDIYKITKQRTDFRFVMPPDGVMKVDGKVQACKGGNYAT